MKTAAAVLVVSLAMVLCATAAAATPTAYRAQVNAICRAYTPAFHRLQAQMNTATKTKDGRAYGLALGQALALALQQDRRVEAVPVPAALKPQVTPILTLMRKIDTEVRLALDRAIAGDTNGMVTRLKAVSRQTKPLNAMLDAAGLRDCGSNQ